MTDRPSANRGFSALFLALEPGRAILLLGGAIAAWWLLAPIYDRLLVDLAGAILRVVDSGEATFLKDTGGGDWIAYSRRLSKFRTDFPALSVRQVHMPLILLPLLIGWLPRRLGWPSPPPRRFAIPIVFLVTCQAVALAAWAQQIVGNSYGVEGARLYPEVLRNVWAAVTIAWRIGGRFVVVIVAWLWAYRDDFLDGDSSR